MKNKYIGFVFVAMALLLGGASYVYPSLGLYWFSNTDPTTVGGVFGATNQLLVRTDIPSLYYKSGPAATNWTQIGGGSASTTTTINNYVTTNGLISGESLYGMGIDSDINFDCTTTPITTPYGETIATLSGSDYTLLRSVMADDITVANGCSVRTGGFILSATGTISGGGTFTRKGNDAVGQTGGATLSFGILPGGGNGANGVTGGAGGGPTQPTNAISICSTTGIGSVANQPGRDAQTLGLNCLGGSGGGCPTAGNGAQPGAVISASANHFYTPVGGLWGRTLTNVTWSAFQGGTSGGSCGTAPSGGGGSGGGWLYIFAKRCSPGWTIDIRGGNGGNAGAGTNGAGGGGGGSGGLAWVVCGSGTLPGVLLTGGIGGLASGNGQAGGNGHNGYFFGRVLTP